MFLALHIKISIMNLNIWPVLWYSDQESVKYFTVSGLILWRDRSGLSENTDLLMMYIG